MKNTFILLSLLLLASSCFKKDDAIVLPDGNTEISSFSMADGGDNYANQVFFDLGTNQFKTNPVKDWDLSFESQDGGFGVFLNGGNNITIRKANLYNMNEPILYKDSAIFLGQPELIDNANGKATEAAMGDWKTYKIPSGITPGDTIHGIYIVQLGYLGGIDRYRKIQILDVNDSFYSIRYAKLEENSAPIIKIYKNKTQNFTFYTFKNGGMVVDNIEPPKELWDLEFTRYRTIIPNPPTTIIYTLTGVLTNPNKVQVCMDTKNKFEDIDGNSVANYVFSNDRNIIGWDNWKTYNQQSSKYTVHSDVIYIIKDTENYYYKLRFLDYYDKQGKSGNPKFEFIRIK